MKYEISMMDREITAMVLCGETYKRSGESFGKSIERARQIVCRTLNRCLRSDRGTKKLIKECPAFISGINGHRKIANLYLVILFDFPSSSKKKER